MMRLFRRQPLGIGLIGCGGYARFHVDALRRTAGVRLAAVYDDDAAYARSLVDASVRVCASIEELAHMPDVRAVEVHTAHTRHRSIADVLCRARKAFSLNMPLAESLDDADWIISTAHAERIPARAFSPHAYTTAFRKTLALLDADAAGDLQAIHLRAVHAGRGEWCGSAPPPGRLEYALPDSDLDKLPLAALTLGTIERVFARLPDQLCAGEAGGGEAGAAFVQMKFCEPGRLGSYDIVHSPDAYVRSAYDAVAEGYEITGTEAYIWCHHLRGAMRELPTLESYIHNEAHQYAETGMGEWGYAFIAAAREWPRLVRTRHAPLVPLSVARHTLAVSHAVLESSRLNRPVAVGDGPPSE